MSKLIFTAACALACLTPLSQGVGAEGDTSTWRGTWKNRRYNTTGPLRATFTRKKGDQVEGRFQGKFMGDDFDYTATFTATKNKSQTDLKGTAELSGDRYQWTGVVKGKKLVGKFKSLKGYFGEFVLQQVNNK